MPQIVEPNAPESKLPDLEPPFLADAAREAIEDGLLDMGMTNREFSRWLEKMLGRSISLLRGRPGGVPRGFPPRLVADTDPKR
jgi:hypothetical protein